MKAWTSFMDLSIDRVSLGGGDCREEAGLCLQDIYLSFCGSCEVSSFVLPCTFYHSSHNDDHEAKMNLASFKLSFTTATESWLTY